MGTLTRQSDTEDLKSRVPVIAVLILVPFLVIALRLAYLQIVKGDYYQGYSNKNRITQRWIPALRGVIRDRNGLPIAVDRPSFDLVVTRAYVKNVKATVAFLNEFLGLGWDDLEFVEKSIYAQTRYRPFAIKKDLSEEQVALVESHKLDERFEGVDIEVSNTRNYLYGELFSHVVGYMGEISKPLLAKLRENPDNQAKYRLGTTIGIFGIEQLMDAYLQGEDGTVPVEVDARGKVLQELDLGSLLLPVDLKKPAQPGYDIITTLDVDLQRVAFEAFKPDETGSIVAINPKNGHVLAMVTKSAFNPAIFSRPISKKVWQFLNDKYLQPLTDRSLRGLYSPGSTFKMLVALAALEEGLIDEHFSVHCSGKVFLGRRSFGCWKHEGHGTVNLHNAIVQSCDVWFYRVGELLGVDKIALWARRLGLAAKTGVGINNELAGLIPTSAWKKKTYKVPWQKGETLVTSIGQGFNLVTPMQMAVYIATLASGGVRMEPKLVQRIESGRKDLVVDRSVGRKTDLALNARNIGLIQNAMKDVVASSFGTAHYFAYNKDVPIAGKTGTVQVVSAALAKAHPKERRYQDHAWFVAYAPADDPQIALAVIVEHGGHGSSSASPKARAVIERFFGLDRPRVSGPYVTDDFGPQRPEDSYFFVGNAAPPEQQRLMRVAEENAKLARFAPPDPSSDDASPDISEVLPGKNSAVALDVSSERSASLPNDKPSMLEKIKVLPLRGGSDATPDKSEAKSSVRMPVILAPTSDAVSPLPVHEDSGDAPRGDASAEGNP